MRPFLVDPPPPDFLGDSISTYGTLLGLSRRPFAGDEGGVDLGVDTMDVRGDEAMKAKRLEEEGEVRSNGFERRAKLGLGGGLGRVERRGPGFGGGEELSGVQGRFLGVVGATGMLVGTGKSGFRAVGAVGKSERGRVRRRQGNVRGFDFSWPAVTVFWILNPSDCSSVFCVVQSCGLVLFQSPITRSTKSSHLPVTALLRQFLCCSHAAANSPW